MVSELLQREDERWEETECESRIFIEEMSPG